MLILYHGTISNLSWFYPDTRLIAHDIQWDIYRLTNAANTNFSLVWLDLDLNPWSSTIEARIILSSMCPLWVQTCIFWGFFFYQSNLSWFYPDTRLIAHDIQWDIYRLTNGRTGTILYANHSMTDSEGIKWKY
jgi:hypothetical protein